MASSSDLELEELRQEVDRIDRSMVELLAERLRVVREIARIKRTAAAGQPAIRPGREAVILRRLVEQAGPRFPAATLVRMWRELLAATTRAQAPLTVVACVPQGRPELWDLARDHFGATVPLGRAGAWEEALNLLTTGAADLAVLPLPDAAARWWTGLPGEGERSLRVVARLPFGPPGPQPADTGAMVVGTIPPDPSGADLSLFALATDADVPAGRVAAAAQARHLATVADGPAGASLHLVERDGFGAAADADLAASLEQAGLPILRTTWLGGYARPLAGVA